MFNNTVEVACLMAFGGSNELRDDNTAPVNRTVSTSPGSFGRWSHHCHTLGSSTILNQLTSLLYPVEGLAQNSVRPDRF